MFILPILIRDCKWNYVLVCWCFSHAMYSVSVHLRVENAYKGANYWSNVIIWIASGIFTKNYRIFFLQCNYFLMWMLATGGFHLFALLGFIIYKFD